MQKNKRAKKEKYEDKKNLIESEREQIIQELSKNSESVQITSKRISAFPMNLVEREQDVLYPSLYKRNVTQQQTYLQGATQRTLTSKETFPTHCYGTFSNDDEVDTSDPTEGFSANKTITLNNEEDSEDLPDDIFEDSLLDEELVRFF